jgi:hypothetical protein
MKAMANFDWRKLEAFCNEIGSCDKCPPTISKHCDEAFKAMEDWKKPQEPKDAPKGWIKLKMVAIGNDIYINTSTIVGLSTRSGASETLTEIYTIGAEDDPWLVEESIDGVIEKIKKA